MPFDPNKPADASLIVAAELREQFNALSAELTSLGSLLGQLSNQVQSDTPHNCAAVPTPAEQGFNYGDPEKQQLADKLTELITALRR